MYWEIHDGLKRRGIVSFLEVLPPDVNDKHEEDYKGLRSSSPNIREFLIIVIGTTVRLPKKNQEQKEVIVSVNSVKTSKGKEFYGRNDPKKKKKEKNRRIKRPVGRYRNDQGEV